MNFYTGLFIAFDDEPNFTIKIYLNIPLDTELKIVFYNVYTIPFFTKLYFAFTFNLILKF